MKGISILFFTFYILINTSVYSQEVNSDSILNDSIYGSYFLRTDISSYIKLKLFSNGDFIYIYKFEAYGNIETRGKWKKKKNKIILSSIKHLDKKPSLFSKKWYIHESVICNNKSSSNDDTTCLDYQPTL